MNQPSRTDRTGRRTRGRPTNAEAARLDTDVREAALTLFLDHGYDGTSMGAVAAAAGTTKASLYTRFPSKDAVFSSVLEWAMQRPDWPVAEPPPPDLDDLESALVAIAEAAVRRALHPDMIKLARIGVGHAARFPELARKTAATAFWPRKHLVVAVLERHVERGSIEADEPDVLAEHFLGMVAAAPARQASFGIVRSPEDQVRHTRSAVRLFLRSLRPDGRTG